MGIFAKPIGKISDKEFEDAAQETAARRLLFDFFQRNIHLPPALLTAQIPLPGCTEVVRVEHRSVYDPLDAKTYTPEEVAGCPFAYFAAPDKRPTGLTGLSLFHRETAWSTFMKDREILLVDAAFSFPLVFTSSRMSEGISSVQMYGVGLDEEGVLYFQPLERPIRRAYPGEVEAFVEKIPPHPFKFYATELLSLQKEVKKIN